MQHRCTHTHTTTLLHVLCRWDMLRCLWQSWTLYLLMRWHWGSALQLDSPALTPGGALASQTVTGRFYQVGGTVNTCAAVLFCSVHCLI
jgi:hypothetical protein